MSDERVDGLREALRVSPENHALRLLLAETLLAAGRADEALVEYEALLAAEALPPESLLEAGHAAAKLGRIDRAAAYADRAAAAGVEGVAELRAELDATLGLDGTLRLVRRGPDDEDASAPPLELESDPRTTFGDVGGLDGREEDDPPDDRAPLPAA